MRKKFLNICISVLVLSSMLCGCKTSDEQNNHNVQSETEETESEEETAVLTVWAEENSFTLMESLVESFKSEYPEAKELDIKLVAASEAAAKDDLLEDVHCGVDVFIFPDDQLNNMIAGGVLSEVPNAEEIKLANVEEAVLAASYNNTLYAYPLTADNGYFMYYDKDYFSDDDVKTLDRMLQVAAENGKKITMDLTSGWYLYSFFGRTGMEFGINDDGVTNYCNWNTTEGDIKGVDVVQSITNLSNNPAFFSTNTFVDGVKDGSVIAGVSGVWDAVLVKEQWGDDYGAVKLPTFTCAGKQVQMSSFTGYKMVGVNDYSKNKEWAHKFAKWISNEENQTKRFTSLNQGPSNKKAAASEEVSKVPAIQAVIEQSGHGDLQRTGQNFWEPCTKFTEIIFAGNPEGISAQEMIDKLVEGLTASIVK